MPMTRRLGVKLVKQIPGYCGPACLKMVLNFFGVDKNLNELGKMMKTREYKHPAGSTGESMVKVAKKFGLDGFVKDWSQLKDIREYVQHSKIPVILSWFSGYESHFSVIVKIDNEYIYHLDPEYDTLRKMSFKRLASVWFEFLNGFRQPRPKLIVRRLIVIYPKTLKLR